MLQMLLQPQNTMYLNFFQSSLWCRPILNIKSRFIFLQYTWSRLITFFCLNMLSHSCFRVFDLFIPSCKFSPHIPPSTLPTMNRKINIIQNKKCSRTQQFFLNLSSRNIYSFLQHTRHLAPTASQIFPMCTLQIITTYITNFSNDKGIILSTVQMKTVRCIEVK